MGGQKCNECFGELGFHCISGHSASALVYLGHIGEVVGLFLEQYCIEASSLVSLPSSESWLS